MQSSERFAVSIAARTPAEAGSVRTPKRIFRLSGWAVRKSACSGLRLRLVVVEVDPGDLIVRKFDPGLLQRFPTTPSSRCLTSGPAASLNSRTS